MDITALNRKRGNIKAQLTKLYAFREQPHTEPEISARLDTLLKLQQKFDDLKAEYYGVLSDAEFKETESILSGIDDELTDLEVSLKLLLSDSKVKIIPESSNIKNSQFVENVKIPEIPLPVFYGKIEDWHNFKSQFKNLITDNLKLNDNQKLYYLQASLKGEAKDIESTDDDFNSLFTALEERYENNKIIVDTHIKNIINFEKMTHESPKELRKLIDCIKKNLRALKVLTYDRDKLSDILLLNVIIQKLDSETRKYYELTQKTKVVPSFDDFLEILENRCQVLDSVALNVSIKPKYANDQSKSRFRYDRNTKSRNVFLNSTTSNNAACNVCKNGTHSVFKCDMFIKCNPQERFEIARKNKLCWNCLGNHRIFTCQSKNACSICGLRHHTLIHRRENPRPPISASFSSEAKGERNPRYSTSTTSTPVDVYSSANELNVADSLPISTCFLSQRKQIILATAVVYVKNAMGTYLKARALLDVGSQCHCTTAEFANRLGVRKEKINIPVSSVNGSILSVRKKIHTTLANSNKSFCANLECLVVPKIIDLLPADALDISQLEMPSDIDLADPYFCEPSKIDILIGAELFFDIMKEEKIRITQSLMFVDSVFGFIASGSVQSARKSIHCGFISQSDNVDHIIRNFWELETIPEPLSLKSEEESFCEKHFQENYKRDETGRFIVKLPLREGLELGDSRFLSERRLVSLWNRLDNNIQMQKLYKDFLKEYEDLGHMTEIVDFEKNSARYFLPHHGVFKPSSSTTKLRVVFDASAQPSSGHSLNACLMNGGVVQEDLFSIMLRFRKHKFAFTADLRRMYRQVLIDPDQRHLQCILWKNSRNGEMKKFQLSTVTYGTVCAPFLATRTLKELAVLERENFPLASETTLSDFYVDDILTGNDDIETALELQQQLIDMLNSAGMHLHKWCSNEESLLSNIPYIEQEYHFDVTDSTIKTLGLRWDPRNDEFVFGVSQFITPHSICTKRSVISSIARLFDPLGLLGPVIVRAKIFLQKLWLLKLDWDQQIPPKEEAEWKAFAIALQNLEKIKVNRYVMSNDIVKLEIHGFCDASKEAYGSTIYLRCVSSTNKITVNLLCSKSRVAPLKVLTIPRLELCAAELLSKLVGKVLTSLKLNIASITLWTDSTIVLHWIHSSPHILKTFVANRVTRIHDLTNRFLWRHVISEDNPADLVSRGLNPERIPQLKLWWNGPPFLHGEITEPVHLPVPKTDEGTEELKNADFVMTFISDNTFLTILLNCSNNYLRLIRILSFICRFLYNARTPTRKKEGKLSAAELKEAEFCLLKLVQVSSFTKEIVALKTRGRVSSSSKLSSLNPFLDKDSLLRVGGRLSNSDLNFNQKHPIILPKGHSLTRIIFEHFHRKNLHAGPQTLLYAVRQQFWPISGRATARKIVHDCIICFKNNPRICEQIMGNLPSERVTPTSPFTVCGVDFCGPFHIKVSGQRRGPLRKIYVAIFICFSTKAIHLEVVSDLSSNAFVATLRRFAGRRGKSDVIYSDNATNFIGARSELKRLFSSDEILHSYFSSEQITWNFIPPRSPNFGGLWEAGVKSFKFHFKRTVGNANLTYEEFLTVMIQIEAILNSRPIGPMSSDANDYEALTPGHFLIGKPLNSLPDHDISDIADNRLSRWQLTSKFVQNIWKRWQHDYLNTLQQRNKWAQRKTNVNKGDLVLLKEDNIPPYKWRRGRIEEMIIGSDDKVRVVLVKTPMGVIKRSIRNICVLPSN